MALITITAIAPSSTDLRGALAGPFWVNPYVGYVVTQENDTGADTTRTIMFKTVNGGISWSKVDDAGSIGHHSNSIGAPMAAWFDKNTPGDSGSKIHVAVVVTSASNQHSIRYKWFDTSTDTWRSSVVDVSGTLSGAVTGYIVSITKSRGGVLFIQTSGAGGSAANLYRSADGGDTWTTRTTLTEGAQEKFQLLPANLADPNDIWCVLHDVSDDLVELKTYDDSADSVSSTTIATGVVENSTIAIQSGVAATVRPSDGHAIVVIATRYDAATADLLCYDIADASSITQKTNLITDVDDWSWPCVFVDHLDTIYVGVLGKPDGTDTVTSLVGVYTYLSRDGGTTWSRYRIYTTTRDDYRVSHGGFNETGQGGRFYPVFFDDDDLDVFGEDTANYFILPDGYAGHWAPNAGLSRRTTFGTYWISTSVGYRIVFDTFLAQCMCMKTTDGGETWKEVDAANRFGDTGWPISTHGQISVWFDKHTPGNSGTKIHCAYVGSSTGATGTRVLYASFNTQTDTWGSVTTINSDSNAVSGVYGQGIGIVRGVNDRLWIEVAISGNGSAALNGIYYSDTEGGSWTRHMTTGFNDLADSTDIWMLFPGNLADPNDIFCLYHDASLNDIIMKVLDASVPSISSTTLSAPDILENSSTLLATFSASIRHSDGAIFVAAWSEFDATGATADLLTAVWDGSAWTQRTNVLTDVAKHGYVDVFIHQPTGELYVAYITELINETTTTFNAALKYKKSTDWGSTWGSENVMWSTGTNRAIQVISSGMSVGADGGRYQPFLGENYVDSSIYWSALYSVVNSTVNDVELQAAGGVETSIIGRPHGQIGARQMTQLLSL